MMKLETTHRQIGTRLTPASNMVTDSSSFRSSGRSNASSIKSYLKDDSAVKSLASASANSVNTYTFSSTNPFLFQDNDNDENGVGEMKDTDTDADADADTDISTSGFNKQYPTKETVLTLPEASDDASQSVASSNMSKTKKNKGASAGRLRLPFTRSSKQKETKNQNQNQTTENNHNRSPVERQRKTKTKSSTKSSTLTTNKRTSKGTKPSTATSNINQSSNQESECGNNGDDGEQSDTQSTSRRGRLRNRLGDSISSLMDGWRKRSSSVSSSSLSTATSNRSNNNNNNNGKTTSHHCNKQTTHSDGLSNEFCVSSKALSSKSISSSGTDQTRQRLHSTGVVLVGGNHERLVQPDNSVLEAAAASAKIDSLGKMKSLLGQRNKSNHEMLNKQQDEVDDNDYVYFSHAKLNYPTNNNNSHADADEDDEKEDEDVIGIWTGSTLPISPTRHQRTKNSNDSSRSTIPLSPITIETAGITLSSKQEQKREQQQQQHQYLQSKQSRNTKTVTRKEKNTTENEKDANKPDIATNFAKTDKAGDAVPFLARHMSSPKKSNCPISPGLNGRRTPAPTTIVSSVADSILHGAVVPSIPLDIIIPLPHSTNAAHATGERADVPLLQRTISDISMDESIQGDDKNIGRGNIHIHYKHTQHPVEGVLCVI